LSTQLPPGPSAPPGIQTLLFARDPLGVLRRCRARYGYVFTLRLSPLGEVVVVSCGDAIEPLLEADPDYVHAGEARRTVLPQASPGSSFGADAAAHRAARERIRAPLAAQVIDARGDLLAQTIEAHLATWPTLRPFRVLSRMRSLSEEVFIRLGLGIDEPPRIAALRLALGRALRTPGNPPALPRERDEGLIGAVLHRVAARRLRPVKELLVDEIGKRRRGGDRPSPGILGRAAADSTRTPDELAEELIVVLAAAQEPPAIAATWLLERLTRTAGLADAYLAEPRGSEFRRAILDETLRLRPPALASLRRTRAAIEVDGHTLEPGTDVMIPFALVHTDPLAIRRPFEFDPRRFTRDGPARFIPFGDGPRACPGEALSRREVEAVAERALNRFRLRFIGRPERPVLRATVLVPNRSGLAVAQPAD
jgi:cytochrome P450 family 135